MTPTQTMHCYKGSPSKIVVEPPEKKHAQVKLDLLQGEQVNIKKKLKPPSYDSGKCLVK